MKLIDLTHTFDQTMPVYPGDPAPEFKMTADVRRDGFTDYQIKTGMHVGTHMDAPLHMIPDGERIAQVHVDRFFGRGRLLDARGSKRIDGSLLKNCRVNSGDVLLVLTGFSKRFRTADYYQSFPEVTEDFAHRAVEIGLKILGLDTPSPDRKPYDVHKILLGAQVLIIENLVNLESLVGVDEFEVVALPAKFDVEGAPVRVVARVP